MKKRYLTIMLAAMTAAALSLGACGSTEEAANEASETTAESTVTESTEPSVEESTPAAEPVTYEVCISSVSDDEAMGYTADGTLYIFSLSELTDEEKALLAEDAVLEITDDLVQIPTLALVRAALAAVSHRLLTGQMNLP